ncbi:MerR family transcriptional regulator [Streptomyces sp. RY43-2]|uniref:MerR family transcriptional regulator n=1 Tax=Streptomyces macrolidinus TaxID=2952607 RepID=A0ABT0ZAZ5_9ACTN|nr:MerR family transcriptional regulator [Streptomyces macrolidinus]MCN9240943.1 MerR family transcriptional regulator [Streptomyces macrolidinus]
MRHTPSGGAGSGTAAADNRLMSIGTVLNVLREEFPDVTISKIRFLEAEGLIEPQRTPSGYRKFTAHDIERLSRVLRMQRDHYLPLKVIREYLDALERGEEVRLPSLGRQQRDAADTDVLGGLLGDPVTPTVARIGHDELLAAVEISEEQLKDWESYGLLVPLADGTYDAEAVTVATLVAELGRHGIEPRHLRVMKAAADREAGLVDQIVAPLRRHRNPQTRAHAEARTKELAGLAVKLHAALVRSALGVRHP